MKKAIVLILAILFAFFVWPTRYVHYEAGTGPHAEQVGTAETRVDRLSGDVYVRNSEGAWQPLHVQRPELLRPDVTGSSPRRQTNTGSATQQAQSVEKMQSTTDDMSRSAEAAARDR